MTTAKKAFVIGDPIKHSRSPLIHGHWLELHGVTGSYEAIHVKPSELGDFVSTIRDGAFAGGNVTLPHKEAILGLVDETTAAAQAIGAANTLLFDKQTGALCADNSDAYGFAANLDELAPDWRSGKTALVLGAGGAARAVVHALLTAGYGEVIIANRTMAKAQTLADAFGPKCRPADFAAIGDTLRQADCLANTTSLGMTGQPPLNISLDNAKPSLIVADIVYAPLKTQLLKDAEARSMKTADGLGMLLHQAAPGFERWFGIKPDVDAALRSVIVADLALDG